MSQYSSWSQDQRNRELNSTARNTNDVKKIYELVEAGADLSSTNGEPWRHTALHQAAYHGRLENVRVLLELGSRLDLPSNPCGLCNLSKMDNFFGMTWAERRWYVFFSREMCRGGLLLDGQPARIFFVCL